MPSADRWLTKEANPLLLKHSGPQDWTKIQAPRLDKDGLTELTTTVHSYFHRSFLGPKKVTDLFPKVFLLFWKSATACSIQIRLLCLPVSEMWSWNDQDYTKRGNLGEKTLTKVGCFGRGFVIIWPVLAHCEIICTPAWVSNKLWISLCCNKDHSFKKWKPGNLDSTLFWWNLEKCPIIIGPVFVTAKIHPTTKLIL